MSAVSGAGSVDELPPPLQALFELSPISEFVLDGRLMIQRSNSAASRSVGGQARPLLGAPFLDLVAPVSRRSVEQAFGQASGSGREVTIVPADLLAADGTEVSVHLLIRKVREASGEGYAVVAQEATSRVPSAAETESASDPTPFDLAHLLFAQRVKDLV